MPPNNQQAPPPRPQFLVWRKQGTMTYSAFNQTQSINIDRLHGIRMIDLRFNGQIDFSAGAADGAALVEAPWQFLTDIRLSGNGKDTIIAESGEGLGRWNYFDYGVLPTRSALSALTGANATFSALLRLDLALPRGRTPIDTALISSIFSSLQLRITIGDEDQLVDEVNDRVAAFDTFEIDVYVGEIVNFRADLFGRIFPKKFFIADTDSTANTAFEIPLPTGNVYRALMLETYDAVTVGNDDPTNALLNNLQIRAGSELFVDLEDDELQEGGALEKQLATAAGYYFLEFSKDGLIGEALDASRVSTLKAVLDKAAVTNSRIRLHALELIPV